MNIGARIGAWHGGKPTARDYVQNGLIAMWDGIENAGWGVHDQNATVWRDLVGTRNIAIRRNAAWTDDSFLCSNQNSTSAQGYCAGTAPFVTGEFVYRLDDAFAPLNEFYLFSSGVATGMFGFGLNSVYTTRGSYGRYRSNIGQYRHIPMSVAATISPFCIYRDGTEMSVTHESTAPAIGAGILLNGRESTNNQSINGAVYVIRLYSRLLSSTEIATNYAIDKARFNLA